jgi:predicted DNA-binding transcriptional regulator AlpA
VALLERVRPLKKLLSEKEIQEIYGIDHRRLQNMRYRGIGPPFVKIGRSVFYRESDFEAFLENHKRNSTSDAGVDAVTD